MNVHDRFIKTLEHEEPDRVPTLAQTFEPPFTKTALKNLPFSTKIKNLFSKHGMFDAAIDVGFDAIWHHFGRMNQNIRNKPTIPDEVKKKYNIKKANTWGHFSENGWYQDGVLKTPELIREWISYIKTWEISGDVHYKYLKKVWDKYIEKGLLTIPTGSTVAYGTWSSIGINRFAYMTRKHMNLVKELAKAWGDITKQYHDAVFETGIDMVFICEDWAFKERTIYKPKDFDEIITPVYTMLAENAHKHGAKLLIHTDGNTTETIQYLINAGIDAIEPLEYESGMRIPQLKKDFGDKITLIGNLSATYTLTYGTVEETIQQTKEMLKIGAPGGGYVMAPGSDVLGTCKYENVKAMIETTKKYGKYPINI